MLNQSFRQVFVATTPTLLSSGSTADLAVGQVAIVDGNTYTPTTSPTYGTNKAISIWLGMPDLSHLTLMAGIPLTNQSSKLIKGKHLKKIRRKRAHRGQTQQVAIGFDGVDTTKTLTAKCGEVRTVYVKLSGNPIDKLYNNQGFIRQYRLDTGCCDDCGGDSCENVSAESLADALVLRINTDSKWNAGGGQLIRARKVLSEVLDTTGAETVVQYTLVIPDNGDAASHAAVQVQVATPVTLFGREGIYSTYTTFSDAGFPPAFSNAGLFTILDCGTCPAGYTTNAASFLYRVTRTDAGSAGALTTLESDYSLAADGEGAVRLTFDSPNQISVYLITSNTENQAAVGTDEIEFLGEVDGKCVLTTPVTTAWTAGETFYKFPKVYQITLSDDPCGTSRLTALQEEYPDLVITEETDGDCVRLYETTIYSDPVSILCGVEDLVFPDLHSFEGVSWTPVAVTPSTVAQAGVVIESAFVNRVTGDCTYDYYPYEADVVHIQVSEYNADYNGNPCEDRWPVTDLQGVKYPVGVGQYVRLQEQKSLSYFLKERSMDPAVREAEGFSFNTDPFSYYDEYTVEFDFSYKVLGWSQTYTDSYHLALYFKEGTGTSFENAILAYASSVGHDVEIDFD